MSTASMAAVAHLRALRTFRLQARLRLLPADANNLLLPAACPYLQTLQRMPRCLQLSGPAMARPHQTQEESVAHSTTLGAGGAAGPAADAGAGALAEVSAYTLSPKPLNNKTDPSIQVGPPCLPLTLGPLARAPSLTTMSVAYDMRARGINPEQVRPCLVSRNEIEHQDIKLESLTCSPSATLKRCGSLHPMWVVFAHWPLHQSREIHLALLRMNSSWRRSRLSAAAAAWRSDAVAVRTRLHLAPQHTLLTARPRLAKSSRGYITHRFCRLGVIVMCCRCRQARRCQSCSTSATSRRCVCQLWGFTCSSARCWPLLASHVQSLLSIPIRYRRDADSTECAALR